MDGISFARGDVVAVVQAYAGDRRSVRLSDALMYDLHIDGDTAEELLGSIGRRFGTRLESFRFTDHFHNEPEVLVARLLEWFCRLFSYRIETKTPLTVAHLCRVVEARHWFDCPKPY